MNLHPITTEKAVRIIEAENTLVFQVGRNDKKEEIKAEIQKLFNVKIQKIRTLIKNSSKFAYVKFKPENKAIDLATKLGMI